MLLFQLDQSRRIDRTLEMQMQLSLWEGDDKVAGLGAHTSDCRFPTADLRTLERCTPYFPIGNPDNHSPVRTPAGPPPATQQRVRIASSTQTSLSGNLHYAMTGYGFPANSL